jgi:hypothetical protein
MDNARVTDWVACGNGCGFKWDANDPGPVTTPHSCIEYLKEQLEFQKRVGQASHEAAERCAGERDLALAKLQEVGRALLRAKEAVNAGFEILNGHVPFVVGAPGEQLLKLMEEAVFTGRDGALEFKLWPKGVDGQPLGWQGSARDLEWLLIGRHDGVQCSVMKEARHLLSHHSAGRLLARLAEDVPERVASKRLGAGTVWEIQPPKPA